MSLLRSIDAAVARWERGVAVGLLAITVVLVVLQVFFRYVLNSSLSWSEEAARYLFIWAALLGFSSSVEAGRLFRFELLFMHLPRAGRLGCQATFALAAAVFLWVIVVHGGYLVKGTLTQSSPAMNLPMGIPYAALPACGLLVSLHFIAALAGARPQRADPGDGVAGV